MLYWEEVLPIHHLKDLLLNRKIESIPNAPISCYSSFGMSIVNAALLRRNTCNAQKRFSNVSVSSAKGLVIPSIYAALSAVRTSGCANMFSSSVTQNV